MLVLHRTSCQMLLVVVLVCVKTVSCVSPSVAKPSATQAKWLDYEMGAVIHFNMQTFDNFMKSGHVVSPDTFNPTQLSTDQWVKAAKRFGAKYVVLTLDHFSGFLLWPSSTNYNYSVKFTKWKEGKGDIAKDFIKSCHKYGLEYGFFYSVHKNWYMGVENYTTQDPKKQDEFNHLIEAQIRELFGSESPYKDPFYIWFDAGIVPGVSPNIGPLVSSLAGESICDECPSFSRSQGLRWVGNEDGFAPLPHWYAVPKGKCSLRTPDGKVLKGDPQEKQFCPSNCDTVIRQHYWFWQTNTSHKVKSVQRLVQQYLNSVGHGCTLILNINPDSRGLVPDVDFRTYKELGRAIKLLYSHVIMLVRQPQVTVGQRKEWHFKGSPLQTRNGSLVLMENIEEHGQLVERYEITYESNEGSLYSEQGSSIGHKRIHPFPWQLSGKNVYGVSLKILKLVTDADSIVLRQVSVYDWNEAVKRNLV